MSCDAFPFYIYLYILYKIKSNEMNYYFTYFKFHILYIDILQKLKLGEFKLNFSKIHRNLKKSLRSSIPFRYLFGKILHDLSTLSIYILCMISFNLYIFCFILLHLTLLLPTQLTYLCMDTCTYRKAEGYSYSKVFSGSQSTQKVFSIISSQESE